MTLWHRSPREVYRVYGEEEYLAGEDMRVELSSSWSVDDELTQANLDGDGREPERLATHQGEGGPAVANPHTPARRSVRLASLGLLVGTAIGVFGLLGSRDRSARPPALRSVDPGEHQVHTTSQVSPSAGASLESRSANRMSAQAAAHAASAPTMGLPDSERPPARPRSRIWSPAVGSTGPAPCVISMQSWPCRSAGIEPRTFGTVTAPVDVEFSFER